MDRREFLKVIGTGVIGSVTTVVGLDLVSEQTAPVPKNDVVLGEGWMSYIEKRGRVMDFSEPMDLDRFLREYPVTEKEAFKKEFVPWWKH